MVKQVIYLPSWDWILIVFYWVNPGDADEILHTLQGFGCSEKFMRQAGDNLTRKARNGGLTFTNKVRRQTLMAIGRTTSPAEFWDTLDHEKGHAVEHIVEALGISHRSEEKEYLAGAISKKMYPVARLFICDKVKIDRCGIN